jgi:putative spermidine/putrescine transport system permease protein
MNLENNWGKASALSAILLGATLVLFYVYNRLVGIDKVKLG